MTEKTLLDAAGRPITVADLPDDATVVIAATVVDAIPATVHGFSIHWAIAPYPLNSTSHRRAVYVDLVPVTDEARKICKQQGAALIRSWTPLTPEGIEKIREEPTGRFVEVAVLDTLREAVKAVRKFVPIPRQPFEQRRS